MKDCLDIILTFALTTGVVIGFSEAADSHHCQNLNFTKRWHYALITAPLTCRATVWLLSDVRSDYE